MRFGLRRMTCEGQRTISSPMAAPPSRPNCQAAWRGRHSVQRRVGSLVVLYIDKRKRVSEASKNMRVSRESRQSLFSCRNGLNLLTPAHERDPHKCIPFGVAQSAVRNKPDDSIDV
jgi:hypothetical protein